MDGDGVVGSSFIHRLTALFHEATAKQPPPNQRARCGRVANHDADAGSIVNKSICS